MNNFNALNQYIASMNQAVNTVMKSNLDLSTRIKALEGSERESNVVSSTGDVDVDKKVELAVTKVKTELLNSIESLIASLDIDKKIEEAISKLRLEINQAVNVDLSVPEVVPVEPVEESVALADDIIPTGDDIVMGMKEEKKKKTTKKR